MAETLMFSPRDIELREALIRAGEAAMQDRQHDVLTLSVPSRDGRQLTIAVTIAERPECPQEQKLAG